MNGSAVGQRGSKAADGPINSDIEGVLVVEKEENPSKGFGAELKSAGGSVEPRSRKLMDPATSPAAD